MLTGKSKGTVVRQGGMGRTEEAAAAGSHTLGSAQAEMLVDGFLTLYSPPGVSPGKQNFPGLSINHVL